MNKGASMRTASTDRLYSFVDPLRASPDPRGSTAVSRPIGRVGAGMAALDSKSEICNSPIVFLVVADDRICDWLESASTEFDWQLRSFASTKAFLESGSVLSSSCLVLDAAMPELDLAGVQDRIAIDRPGMPIILIQGRPAALTTRRARPAVTVRLLSYPPDGPSLVHAVADALDSSQA